MDLDDVGRLALAHAGVKRKGTEVRPAWYVDDRLVVRLDITSLLPVLGPLLGELCKHAPGDLCTAIGLDPNQLLGVLGSLLGLGGTK